MTETEVTTETDHELKPQPAANMIQKSKFSTLDVGCGGQCLPEAIGIDIHPFEGVDHVHDLNLEPWPLHTDSFQYVRCQHAIEHIQNLRTLCRELHRVSADGAEIYFITPHYSSYASWGDPTHIHHFSLTSIPLLFEQVLGKDAFDVIESRLQFTGSALDLPGWLISKASTRKYEKHFAWIWPANEIHIRIRVRKSRPAITQTQG